MMNPIPFCGEEIKRDMALHLLIPEEIMPFGGNKKAYKIIEKGELYG